MPKVNIIVPTFNRCENLEGAIESALAQTIKDIEIIIVDDGSTDKTPEVIAELETKYSNIKSFRFEKNRGGNSARNEGLKQSSADLVAFLDDDDRWHVDKLEKQLKAISEKNVDLCYSAKNVIHLEKNGKSFYSHKYPRYKNNLYKSIMHDNFIGSTSSVIIKRKIIEEAGDFDESLPALQDYDLYIRIIKNGGKVYGFKEPLIDYVIISEERSITCRLDVFNEASKILNKKYNTYKYYNTLKWGLRWIWFRRFIKTRQFTKDVFKI